MRILSPLLAMTALLCEPALAAGNFEFAVPGEPGLKMQITGYAADGSTLFQSGAGGPELRDGQLFHTFRIDDTFQQGGALVKWCVEESTGKWSLAQGSTAPLCDTAPSETRGRYVFRPSDEAAIAAAPPTSVSMTPGEATSCVQAGLNGLGYPAGVVDGAWGGKPAAAADEFAARQDVAWPDLTTETVADWCARLTAALVDGSARPPSDLAAFRFGPDIDSSVAIETRKAIEDIDIYFREVFGTALQQPGTIYVSSDATWMADAYLRQTGLGQNYRRGKLENFEACNGGEAGYGFLFMCAKSDVFSGDWFNAGSLAQRTFGLAHEYFHILQFERAYDDAASCCESRERLGPQWLVEGAAEYVAFRILADSKRLNLQREIDWHTRQAGKTGLPLAEMHARDGFYSEPLASSAGMIAAHMLAESAGLGALGQFYTELGTGQPWSEAFEAAFGETLEAFEARYEAAIH